MQPELRETQNLLTSIALLAGASHASADQHGRSLFDQAAHTSALQALTALASVEPMPQVSSAASAVLVASLSAVKSAALPPVPVGDLPFNAHFETTPEAAPVAFVSAPEPAAMLTRPDWFVEEAPTAVAQALQESADTTLVSADAVANPASLLGENFLIDLLEALKQAAEEARAEFAEAADGSRQDQIGAQLRETAQEIAQDVRGFFQDNVRGQVREASEELLQTTELGMAALEATQPLTGFDYYGASAEVINTSIDAIASPLGGVRLPSVGPLLANPQDEITSYLQF